MNPVTLIQGNSPVVLAMPHSGTWLPESVKNSLNSTGLTLADTDWHIDRLYNDLLPDVTIVKANFHRYVIDANRDPEGKSLYPGQNTTELCPLTDFNGEEIYHSGQAPSAKDVDVRRDKFHKPYHDILREQLVRIKQRHKVAVLYDCHSIRSRAPFLFDGKLPDLNIGTFDGRSCDPEMARLVHDFCVSDKKYQTVINGRFKGGWTTRHYGQPESGIHAIQMELSQCNYMQETSPWNYNSEAASTLRAVLRPLLQLIADTALSLGPVD